MATLENVNEAILDLIALENQKRVLKEQLEKLDDKEEELKKSIMPEMKLNNLKTYENEEIRITYIEETSRETIDSAKLKKEYPDVASNCRKVTTIKENWKITLKENK